MEGIHTILGAVALLIVSVALIFGLIIIVLMEARWTLRLCVDLHRRWRASIRQFKDEDVLDPQLGGGTAVDPPHSVTPESAHAKEDR